MAASCPTVLVPGLMCSPRLYAEQLPLLWRGGLVAVADHRRDDSIVEMAHRLLSQAPPRFALAGLSMGGYVALEVMRQAPQRVQRLALLCTSARPDAPEQSQQRRAQIDKAASGQFSEVVASMLPKFFAASKGRREELGKLVQRMAEETGPEVFIRQQQAIMGRADSRPHLASITCPTLVLAGEEDQLIPAAVSAEMAQAIPGARLVSLPGCGHLATLDDPQAVNRALEAHWDA